MLPGIISRTLIVAHILGGGTASRNQRVIGRDKLPPLTFYRVIFDTVDIWWTDLAHFIFRSSLHVPTRLVLHHLHSSPSPHNGVRVA
jgi:hypothetical protein